MKFAVLDLAAAERRADAEVVGRIGYYHRREIFPHERRPIRLIAGITAQHAMLAELPELSSATDGLLGDDRGGVRGILVHIAEIGHQAVDLGRLKPGDVEAEIALGQEGGELSEFCGKKFAIPACIGRNLVVGNGERALFGVAEAVHHEDGDLL